MDKQMYLCAMVDGLYSDMYETNDYILMCGHGQDSKEKVLTDVEVKLQEIRHGKKLIGYAGKCTICGYTYYNIPNVSKKQMRFPATKMESKEYKNNIDMLEIRCEHSEISRQDKQLRELFLAHVMWLQATGKRVPDKYMKLGQKWGGDAEFWVKNVRYYKGDKSNIIMRTEQLQYTVTGTSRPAWMAWRMCNKAVLGLINLRGRRCG